MTTIAVWSTRLWELNSGGVVVPFHSHMEVARLDTLVQTALGAGEAGHNSSPPGRSAGFPASMTWLAWENQGKDSAAV